MFIITKKLFVPMNLVQGKKTYGLYPLQFAEVYNSSGVLIASGMTATGPMEIKPDINNSYYGTDGFDDGYECQYPPSIDPDFVQKYDEIATRVEM